MLQTSLRGIATRLGHPACFSGCDLFHIGQEREFVLHAAADGATVQLNPQPLPPSPPPARLGVQARHVVVAIPDKVNNDIEAISKTVAQVMGKLGCAACCSGFDLEFQREIDLIAVDSHLNVQGFGRFQ